MPDPTSGTSSALMATDVPASGADTYPRWFGEPDIGWVRVNSEWFEPVHNSLALVFDPGKHRNLLRSLPAGRFSQYRLQLGVPVPEVVAIRKKGMAMSITSTGAEDPEIGLEP
ncbi:hypothetical protein ABZW96_36290 [Nocardia sp. NPDC004168]|uniref:hypothetical protein n=1 Tax=Nocardia sp. NPDC004168 TaxID=3154452 RepID=UPI0033BEE95F